MILDSPRRPFLRVRRKVCVKCRVPYLLKHGWSTLSFVVHGLFPSGVLYKATKAVHLQFAFKLREANGAGCFDHSLEIKNVVGRLSDKPSKSAAKGYMYVFITDKYLECIFNRLLEWKVAFEPSLNFQCWWKHLALRSIKYSAIKIGPIKPNSRRWLD